MLDELEAAANRGVRVRLLLDDNGIAQLDGRLATLDLHAHVEVRLYNSFHIRKPKALNWLFDFNRLKRRMHSKSLTVDNHITIVGGRNIGDEYFGARRDGLFADLDLLAAGPIVPQVSQAFDRYWTSGEAHPANRVFSSVSSKARQTLASRAAAIAQSEQAESYREAIRALPLFDDMSDGAMALVWAVARLIADDPVKVRKQGEQTGLAEFLAEELRHPKSELTLISGYFVPTCAACNELAALTRRGIKVRVLTNSYAATDVGLVHVGYAPYRQRLLKAGIELFEMPGPDDKPKTASKFIRSGSARLHGAQAGRSLHAKAFIVDRNWLYVGSANFDPRSAHLNTELGVVIESRILAGEMSRSFDEFTHNSYRLGLDSSGRVQWMDERDDMPQPNRVEPGTSLFSRNLIRLLSCLPLERLL